ncbi:MAG TPA: hypothetical protein VF226_18665 [Hyphomicrobiaceae bacterium]
MSIANPAVCDIPRRPARLTIVAARTVAGATTRPGVRAYSFLTACRARSSCEGLVPSRQIREEGGEYDIPDPTEDEHYEPRSEAFDAADAHTEEQREAMALLDDAENLLAVLMAAIEDDGDSRAMQTEAVLKVVKEKLREAHTRIDRQESQYRNLFLAYFELKAESEREVE